MKRKNTTRNALVTSIISLLLCVSMLVGATFAWFTDSVTSEGNKIQSGNLKVDLELLDKDGNWASIKANQDPIFNYDLWEPGYVDTKILKIENEGSLALKWYAKFQADGELSILANVIDVYVLASETPIAYPTDRTLPGYTKVGTVAEFVNTIETTTYGSLKPMGKTGDTAYLGIALKMQEDAGNEYQNLSIGGNGGFDIMILATQETYEKDSFDEKYDEDADYGYYEGAGKVVDTNPVVIEVRVPDPVNDTKIATVEVPAAAVADSSEEIKVTVTRTAEGQGVTVAADQSAKHFEVNVTNIAEDNETPIKVELRVGTGLTGIKVYHDGEEVSPVTYVGEYVIFYTTSFSPFSVVYDAVAVEEDVETLDKGVPVATVTDADEYENVPLAWTGWGGYNPTAGAAQQLNSVYLFESPDTSATVEQSFYKNWYCDYYVKFVPAEGSAMTKLPEGSITLGGNYGGYGWVGFDNPEVDVNTFIPLLGSVLGSETDSGWTYEAVVDLVQKFWCGVGVANGNTAELNGAKFVVELRLTNPENENDCIPVNTVTYTFGTGESEIVNYNAN